MMTIEEMIAVLTHYKNGGKVQCRHESESVWQTFVDCDPRWDFAEFSYRAKPEPLVIYAEIMTLDGKAIQYSTKEFKSTNGGTVKKFVEVTE
ncbi:MAG: hypothetical protein NTV52_02975 [Acidobacteria bacterium]|nr:hypothetical protein [Acidobacteriota bacterium]